MAIVLLMGGGFSHAEKLDRIVAVVNGDIVLYSELQEQIQEMSKIAPELNTLDSAQRSQLEREVLRQMIRDRLTDQEMRRLKIVVSSREVDETIAAIKQENNFTDAQFDYVIQQSGKTREQFREGVKKELERARMVDRVFKSKTVITPEQINAHLQGGSGGYRESRNLSLIFLPFGEETNQKKREEVTELGQDLARRLKGGADFASIAREYSKGPGAQTGGDIGYIEDDELAPHLEKAIRRLKVNEISDPVVAPNGVYIFKVTDIRRQKQDATDAATREKIERQLLQAEIQRKFEDWIRDLESRSFIEVLL